MKGAIMMVVQYTVFTTVFTVFTYEGVYTVRVFTELRMRVYMSYLKSVNH